MLALLVCARKQESKLKKLKLENSHFYFILLGELYRDIDIEKARLNFEKAYNLAKTDSEKQEIQKKIDSII